MSNSQRPVILKQGTYTEQSLAEWKDRLKIWQEIDLYKEQLEELFEIDNPEKIHQPDIHDLVKGFVDKHAGGEHGNWVYYPWSGLLVHTVTEDDYFRLRTNRNQNIITAAEQKKLYGSTALIMGLSVGNSIATTLSSAGFAKKMLIADFDKLSTANLNRVKAQLTDVGKTKTQLAREQIYGINPYAELVCFGAGIQMKDLESIQDKIDIIFDEVDDFAMKVQMRYYARDKKIPLVMMTSLGDNVLVDVERYDIDDKQAPFFGTVPENILSQIVSGDITEEDKKRYAVQLVDAKYVPTRALQSLTEIGKTLVGRPQLANAIALDGGLATVIMKKVILGAEISGGRYYFDVAEILGSLSDTTPSNERSEAFKMIMGDRDGE